VENDGISLSYPEDSTGPTSLHPHPNFKPFLFFTLESSKLLLILLLNKTLLSLEIIGSPSTQTAKVVTREKTKSSGFLGIVDDHVDASISNKPLQHGSR
jgi:hypothetical protein